MGEKTINEQIDAIEAYGEGVNSLNTILVHKRNICVLTMSDLDDEYIKEQLQYLEKNGFFIVKVPKKTNDNENVIVGNNDDQVRLLNNYMVNHNGYISDNTPEEAMQVGKMLQYDDNSIKNYINKKYNQNNQSSVQLTEQINKIKNLF